MAQAADREPPEDGWLSVVRRVDQTFSREFPSGDPSATECALNLIYASGRFLDADSRALRRHGLSTAARIMLAAIEGTGEALPANVLAERLFVSGASVTSLVDTLERRGLVRRLRSETDRRVVLVELTDAARPIIDEYLAEVTALHAAEFAVFDSDEREQFVQLLARLAVHIETLDVDAVTAGTKPRRRPKSRT